MTKYSQKCWKKYLEDRSASRLVNCVYHKAVESADDKNWVRKGTEALVRISRALGPHEFIPLKEIQIEGDTKLSKSGGLWPWLKENRGADVLESRLGPKSFKIREEFFKAMLELFPEGDGTSAKHRVMELAGLGKETWAGVDPKEYVERERSNWGG